MKIKELQKTVNVAWSPAEQNPIMLAAGTSAQQLDASFNTAASLEIYSINLSEPGYEMELKAATPSQHRFNKVVWSHHGFGAHHPNGLIVGGCENGFVQLYSASKLLDREESLLGQQNKHSGSVSAIDFNPFQANLLATGASESEIFIWDLNNITNPMTPGTKVTPNEDVLSVNWNKQVQHILATLFASKCVIWDLRKNEPIIKLHDAQSRVRWRALQWNPEVATQMWIGSDEDSAPSVQLWDLRYATAPAKSINIHQRGVLGLTWCTKDSDLMVSSGKDNKILCWNPNSEVPEGEILSEIATTNQWCFDVSWCPRNPAIIAGCSFEGTVSVYSLFGGSVSTVQTTNKIADSFPGMDATMQAPMPQTSVYHETNDLRKPPKWLKKPVGACFAFGGKLFTFNNKDNKRIVTESQVITDEELIKRSNDLETVLAQGNFAEYCKQKADQTHDQHSRYVWYFLKANFDQNPRAELLNLLGYHPDEISSKFSQFIKSDDSVNALTNKISNMNANDGTALFDTIGQIQNHTGSQKDSSFKLKTGNDSEGLICEALLTGNIEAAVDLCMDAGRTTDAIILAMTGGSELLARTQFRYLRDNDSYISNIISALVTHDWNEVVSQCSIDSWKEALVAALTHSQEQLPMLCERIGERLQQDAKGDPTIAKNAILCYICSGSMERLVEAWSVVETSNQSTPTKGGNKSKNIQDLVEVLMIMQKAGELQGKNVDAVGKVADVLSKYAGLLAAQGSLNSALTYLGPSIDPDLVELKERLYYALGHKQTYSQRPQQNQYGSAQPTNRFSQPRVSLTSGNLPPIVPQQPTYPTNTQPTSYFNPTAVQPAPIPTWNQPNFNSTPASIPANKPQVAGPPPMEAQPPRPASQNSNLLTSRSKYVVDPSVQSGSNYGQTGGMYGASNPSSYTASSYTQGAIPPAPQFNQFNTNPMQTTNQYTPFQPPPIQSLSGSGINAPPVEMGQPALITPQQRNPVGAPGWNDPPALSGSRPLKTKSQFKAQNEMYAVHAGTKKWGRIIDSHAQSNKNVDNKSQDRSLQPPADTGNVAPITHPLFGVDPNQGAASQNGYHQEPQVNYGAQQPPQAATPYQQQPYGAQPLQAHSQPTYPPTSMSNQQGFPTQLHYQNFNQQQMNEPPARNTPEPPKQKAPLPEEYIYMQTVFDELRTRCINASTNPQSKRKLEDVAKRLEFLYDLLRENRLSPSTLESLNQLVQLIQVGDYANGLALHTRMVSGADFSTIASFMPGIKVLLQSAMQLQVYLR